MTQPTTLSAGVQPCALYMDHGSSRPVIVQGHHRHPVYLQRRLWGEVRDEELIWLCGTCHDSVHAWLYWVMEERAKPSEVPLRARAEAQQTWAWFLREK